MGSVRIAKELAECQGEDLKAGGIAASLVGDDMRHWKGRIAGPHGTPYEGGTFYVDIRLPDDYPFVPPKMKFETRLWHPNVSSQTGAICLDILKDQWSPALTMRTALLSLQALLSSPEPDDPQDAQVAGQYKSDLKAWERTASEWTERHAKGAPPGEEKVQTLVAMGFPADRARAALEANGMDAQRALDSLLGGA